MNWWRSAAFFLLTVAGLHGLWTAARGTPLERAVIDQATVHAAVALINRIAPEVGAYPEGSRVRAPGGGINILNGCEGTEVLFLLVAGLAISRASWRQRGWGLLIGTLLVFVLNQARVVTLFFTYRDDPALFAQLHGFVTPVVLVVVTLLYFLAWLDWTKRHVSPVKAVG